MNKYIILIFCILFLITPVCAMEITSEVTDKTIWSSHGHGACYLIHTKNFGDIDVSEDTYQKIMIGDNITFNTESEWGYYRVTKINNDDYNGL